MSRGKQYTVAGRVFPTQASLEAEIRGRLAVHGSGRLFQDDWLAGLINTYNAEVRAVGQRVTGWFRRLTYSTMIDHGLLPPCYFDGFYLVAEFAPSGRWCDLSAYPWRESRGRHSDLRKVLLDEPEVPRLGFTLARGK